MVPDVPRVRGAEPVALCLATWQPLPPGAPRTAALCLWGTRADRLPGGRARGRSAGDVRAGVLREDAPEPPRPLGLGRSSATLSPPSRKEDRAGAWDVSHGRGGTRPRTLSLGLDAPSGARLPRTAGCCAARPVTRHPAAPPGPAAGLLCVSPARRPGACPLTLPLRAHTGRCPRPAPVMAQAAVPRGWGHDAVCDVDAQPGAGAWAPPPSPRAAVPTPERWIRRWAWVGPSWPGRCPGEGPRRALCHVGHERGRK